jgi:predicted esterase YcpF (UPF0227 family)
MIIYLHGFKSSPHSFKARYLAEKMASLGLSDQFYCPQLPASPQAAIAMVLDVANTYDPAQLTIVGSSLGGYYATWLREQLHCRAVVLNPAVTAPRNLASYVGVSTQYHTDAPFEFKAEYIDELMTLKIEQITEVDHYYLIASTGDEVLDWRDMVRHYAGAKQTIIQGSDHSISEFAEYASAVLAFCGVDDQVGALQDGRA